jgi:hypothetical protein
MKVHKHGKIQTKSKKSKAAALLDGLIGGRGGTKENHGMGN